MKRYVIVKDNMVENAIVLSNEQEYVVKEPYLLFEHDKANIGDVWPYVEPVVVEEPVEDEEEFVEEII